MPYRQDAINALSELNDTEALAFAALVRTIVRADGQVSEGERDQLAGIANDVGEERFWNFMAQANKQARGREAVETAVRAVERPSARELIYATLADLAITGTIVPREADVLDWLAGVWKLAPQPVEAPPES